MTITMEGLVATFKIDEEIYHVKKDSYCGSKNRRQRMRGRRRRLCIVLLETRENKSTCASKYLYSFLGVERKHTK